MRLRLQSRTGLPRKGHGLPEEGSYLIGCESENSIQVLHQLFERRPLRGHSMPAIPHHHIPGETELLVNSLCKY